MERLSDVVNASKKLAKKDKGLKKKVSLAKRKAKAYAKLIKQVKKGGSVEKKKSRKKRRRSRRTRRG